MFRRLWLWFVRVWWIHKLMKAGLPRPDAEVYVNAVLSGQIPARKRS